jgi:hypothetical protein
MPPPALASTILSVAEEQRIDAIARELETNPDLPTDRLRELIDEVGGIAERYMCDPRFADD